MIVQPACANETATQRRLGIPRAGATCCCDEGILLLFPATTGALWQGGIQTSSRLHIGVCVLGGGGGWYAPLGTDRLCSICPPRGPSASLVLFLSLLLSYFPHLSPLGLFRGSPTFIFTPLPTSLLSWIVLPGVQPLCEHRWELTILRYHKIMVIYHYPF